MHFSRSCVVYVVLIIFSSSAIAAPKPDDCKKSCDPADEVYALLRGPLKAEASWLCLSYLGGDKTIHSTRTKTITEHATTVTTTRPAQTEYRNSKVTDTIEVTTTDRQYQSDATATVLTTVTAATTTIYQKRGEIYNIPYNLGKYGAARISSACHCIVTPKTRTVTTTRIKSIPGHRHTSTAPGRISIVVKIQTVKTTDTISTTNTNPPTSTDTITTTSIATPAPVIEPKICNVQGLPNTLQNDNYSTNFDTDQATCIASCKTDSRCLSTGFYMNGPTDPNPTAGTCRYYSAPVAESADLDPVGYYTFNDKAC